MSLQKILSTALLAVMLFGLILCPAESVKAEDDQLVIGMASDILSMDPYKYDEGPTNQFMRHIFEALVMIDEDLVFQPLLAESFEQAEDGLSWTFKLREGVKFHDGSEFSAKDVKASIEVAKNPDAPSAFVNYLSAIEEIDTPDDYTVIFHLSRVDSIFLFELSNIYILKAENILDKTEQEIAQNPIGTGRYEFVEQVKEDHVDLSFFEDYWGEEPEFKNVRFRPISNDATRTATMLSGELDFMIDVPVRDVERLENSEGLQVLKRKGLREIYVNLDARENSPHFPEGENPMSDLRVRQAMFLAIDRETIIKNIMNKHAYLMNSIIPENYVGEGEVEMPEYNPERAKELLVEAGYPEGFEITFDAPNDRYVNDAEIAQAVAAYWEKIGIKVNLNLMPKANFFTHIACRSNKSMALMTGWSDASVDGSSVLKDMTHSYEPETKLGNVNRGHFSSEELDKLIEAALAEPDVEKRAELIIEANKIVAAELPVLPLHFEEDTYAIKDGVEFNPTFDKMVYAWRFHNK